MMSSEGKQQLLALDQYVPPFYARFFIYSCLPHSKTENTRRVVEFPWMRVTFTSSDASVGLPYGSIPRVLIAHISSHVARYHRRRIDLPGSFAALLRRLGYGSDGRNVRAVQDQLRRLCNLTVHVHYKGRGEGDRYERDWRAVFANETAFSWDDLDRAGNYLVLDEEIFGEFNKYPIPVTDEVVEAFRKSPLALDFVLWLVHRLPSVKQGGYSVSYRYLMMQFGGWSQSRRAMFRDRLRAYEGRIRWYYPKARFKLGDTHVYLWRSRPLVDVKGDIARRRGGG
jgi:hypothetical protein